MDLTVCEVAELLGISETKTESLAAAGDLPSYQLNGKTRFSCLEIENWVVSHRELTPESHSQKGVSHFSLFRALHHGDVIHNVVANNREEIIRAGALAASSKLSIDSEVLTELLLEREEMVSTAIGSGFAIPHPRESLPLTQDLLFILYPENPVAFGALDGKPVHTFFFLFSSSDKAHLSLLSKISHFIGSDSADFFLQGKNKRESHLSFVRKWEGSLQ